ncbi:hypothetical protein [Flavilitoribacter nigricans]|uniref:Uncharacterized protein n=1 Tax=Flavilitoribacter nigricans (strain ATCC 23147 / DSM 23189 / NBRC 102662 / NCIMB 1420 / SS-2) TaxID=1122177 RepID=A0A2D0NCE1_FLAN2|nr:hypothetical protein [Flavilitoribacter nigricans]PHN06162.1 hypothetical protein CRP01_11295 [Flavilitoribacter nigricans DSM 23189 = NBRC 102662]
MAQAVISSVLASAHQTMVQRDDDSVVSLGEHMRAPGGTAIVGVLQGAHAAVVRNSAGDVKALADHIRAAGGETVDLVLSGAYAGLVQTDQGILSVGDYQVNDEANP